MSDLPSIIFCQQRIKYISQPGKNGMAGGMLILVFCICLIMLPAGTWLIRSLHDEVLLRRTNQAADHVLSTLPQVVNKAELSRGELKLDLYQTQFYLQQQSDQLIPDALKNRIILSGVMIEQKQGDQSSMHWRNQDQERHYYQVSCLFSVTGLGHRQYEVKRTVYLLLD